MSIHSSEEYLDFPSHHISQKSPLLSKKIRNSAKKRKEESTATEVSTDVSSRRQGTFWQKREKREDDFLVAQRERRAAGDSEPTNREIINFRVFLAIK